MYLPNAFSPSDHDELNDTWKPSYAHLNKKSYSLRIFDRWGHQIYYNNDPDIGWDGKIDSQNNLGVYNYIIECRDDRGITHAFSGCITILVK
jgi:gliding motility-associated-like protein